MSLFSQELSSYESLMVLDGGSGPGLLTEALRTTNPNHTYVNLDLSLSMARYARVAGPTIVGDLHKMPVRSGTMDVLILRQVLHYCSPLAAVLGEARRVLRRDGRLLIGQFVPANRAEQGWMDPILAIRQPLRTNYFSIEDWTDTLAKAGFKLVRSTRIGVKESLNSWLRRYPILLEDEAAVRRAFEQRDRRLRYPQIWSRGCEIFFKNWFALLVFAPCGQSSATTS